jgi:hypothetical protein
MTMAKKATTKKAKPTAVVMTELTNDVNSVPGALPPKKTGRPRTKPQFATREEKKAYEDKLKFHRLYAELPEHAAAATEILWVKNHPAMTRLDRMTLAERSKVDRIILGSIDIDAPHGKAPSKGAVQSLQSWCNRPDEFFKLILNEQKKLVASGKIDPFSNASLDEDLPQEVKDIDALLLSLDYAVTPDGDE